MVARVSTYNTSNNLFSQTQRLQASYAKATEQSSSGLRSANFEGISADAQRLLTLQAENNNLVGQSLAIKSAQGQISATQNIVSTMSDTLSKALSLITNILGGIDLIGGAASNAAQATVLRDTLVSQLNTQSGGIYLFGGSVKDRAPVDLTDPLYTPTAAPGTPDYDYYQGDNVVDSVRASDSLRVDYGVTANNPAFEQALRALSIIIASPSNQVLVAQAHDITKQAIAGVAAIGGNLLARANIVEQAASINETTSAYLDEQISGVRDVDVAAASVKLSQIDAQLQTSYSSLSKLLQLRLTDYLR
jgi:flagellar hook-associated protein 3 FlgL